LLCRLAKIAVAIEAKNAVVRTNRKVVAHRHRPNGEKATVLEEILEWSQDRPAWQRDALRRLVVNGELSEGDIRDLSEICKSAYGLAEQQHSVPLAKDHVPKKAPVRLNSHYCPSFITAV